MSVQSVRFWPEWIDTSANVNSKGRMASKWRKAFSAARTWQDLISSAQSGRVLRRTLATPRGRGRQAAECSAWGTMPRARLARCAASMGTSTPANYEKAVYSYEVAKACERKL